MFGFFEIHLFINDSSFLLLLDSLWVDKHNIKKIEIKIIVSKSIRIYNISKYKKS